jgi:hypothetical protein
MGDTIPWGDPRSIWPGPADYEAPVWHGIRSRRELRRAEGIAQGHVRVRARMRRFRLWLAERQAPATLRYAAEHALSPEALFSSLVPSEHYHELAWLFSRLDDADAVIPWRHRLHNTDWSRLPALVAEAIAATWASLPWQQEPAPRG